MALSGAETDLNRRSGEIKLGLTQSIIILSDLFSQIDRQKQSVSIFY